MRSTKRKMRKNNPFTPAPKLTRLTVREESQLMEFLLSKMGGMSRTSVKSLLSHRQVSVNDKITTHFNYQLKPNDVVIINTTRGNLELNHPLLKVVYEDKDFVVVEKKEGLLTVTAGSGRDITAFSILKNYVKKSSPANKIYTVHRLDKDTSGLLVFSKNRDFQHILRNNWHKIVTKRTYVAVVEGKVTTESDTIVSWLTEDKIKLKAISSKQDNGGKKAITHYKLLKAAEDFSLLELELETGRKNQIRVHMEDIGHPIVGDRKYGSTTGIGRVALHAHVLEFHHPTSGKLMRFESKIPKEFQKLVR